MGVLLITDTDLIKGSPLGGNISLSKYRSVIEEIQIFNIEPILGTKLYEKIKTDYDAETITGLYNTILVNYVQPIIINMVVAEYVIISRLVMNNSGVHIRTPENLQPASESEVSSFASRFRAKAEVFEERLQRFLQDQISNIAEYTTNQDTDYDIKPDKDVNLYGGFYLPYDNDHMTSLEKEMWKDIYWDLGRR